MRLSRTSSRPRPLHSPPRRFKAGEITTFKPYSKYPPVFKDMSFWIPDEWEPNDLFEVGREVCGELVETMELVRAPPRSNLMVRMPPRGADVCMHARMLTTWVARGVRCADG